MTNRTIHLWLIVVVALAGLAVAIPAVSAHGTDTTAADAPVDNATAGEWAAWMEGQMIQHMGPDSVEWMESHMGVTVEEMSQEMTNGNYTGGMYGQGHC